MLGSKYNTISIECKIDIQIQHVFRVAKQLVDAVANKACEQQMKLIIQSKSQLIRTCKGITRLDKLQLPTVRIRTRRIYKQG